MGKQIVGFAVADTGYTIADITWGHCNRIDTGVAIDTTGSTLTHQSNGQYVLYVPNVTHTTGPASFFLSVTADPSKYVEGTLNPILGDEARHSVIGAWTGSGVNTVLGAMEAIADKLVSGVTVDPLQVGNGLLKTIAIRTNNATIRVKRGDVYYQAFNLGATFYKSGARFYFCAKEVKTDGNASAVVNREMTVSNAALASVNITFTTAETATVKTYFAEIERRDADGTSNPRTCWEGTLEISQDNRQ